MARLGSAMTEVLRATCRVSLCLQQSYHGQQQSADSLLGGAVEDELVFFAAIFTSAASGRNFGLACFYNCGSQDDLLPTSLLRQSTPASGG